jgi:hypothetical protein
MVRRAAALGGVVIVLLFLIFGIKGCADSAKKSSLRDYNTNVASLARDSDTQVSRPFFQLLSNPGRTSPVNVEAQINQYRATAGDQARRGRAMDVPGQMSDAHRYVITALDLRAEALTKIADQIRAALGTGDASSKAVDAIAGDMQAFLTSDVLWSQRVAPLIKQELDSNDVTGQVTPLSRSLPNLGWLDPGTVADRLGAQGGGTSGAVAPGAHGHGLVAVAVGPTTLQPGSVNRIPAATSPVFTVRLQNQGDNPERRVVVNLKISGAGRPITAKSVVDQTQPGQTSSVNITLGKRPPVGTPVTIAVAVAPVAGEKKTDNNRQEYPALFTR